MSTSRRRIATLAVSSIAALSLGLAGCAVGEIGGDSGATEGQTEITYLFGDSGGNEPCQFAEALTKKFNEMNPDIKVSYRDPAGGHRGRQPDEDQAGHRGDADVFAYNSGSLFQALSPDKNLVPLTDEAWVATCRRSSRAWSAPTRAPTVRPPAPPRPAESSTTRRCTPTSA